MKNLQPVVGGTYILVNPYASRMPEEVRGRRCVIQAAPTSGMVLFSIPGWEVRCHNPSGYWECGREYFNQAFTSFSTENILGNFPKKSDTKEACHD